MLLLSSGQRQSSKRLTPPFQPRFPGNWPKTTRGFRSLCPGSPISQFTHQRSLGCCKPSRPHAPDTKPKTSLVRPYTITYNSPIVPVLASQDTPTPLSSYTSSPVKPTTSSLSPRHKVPSEPLCRVLHVARPHRRFLSQPGTLEFDPCTWCGIHQRRSKKAQGDEDLRLRDDRLDH